MDDNYDVLIVGGGLIGAACAIALQRLGYRSLLLESKPLSLQGTINDIAKNADTRSLALASASVRILRMLDVWPVLEAYATPITTIHISEQGCFGSARLKASSKEPLGYVIDIQSLAHALYTSLAPETVITPSECMHVNAETGTVRIATPGGERMLHAQWIIAADGADSTVRRLCTLSAEVKHYPHRALVANIRLQRDHDGYAYERFTSDGPLAMLPLSERCVSMVWSLPVEKAAQYQMLAEAPFLRELQRAFGYRLGRFIGVGQRLTYTLAQTIMPQPLHHKVLFIGNAAHTLHPVAGQGFNLGLRDVATLAQCFAKEGLSSLALDAYQSMREADQQAIIRSTDGLITLFGQTLPGLSCLRGMSLFVLDNSRSLKRLIKHYASGFGGVVPELVCGIPLWSNDGAL